MTMWVWTHDNEATVLHMLVVLGSVQKIGSLHNNYVGVGSKGHATLDLPEMIAHLQICAMLMHVYV